MSNRVYIQRTEFRDFGKDSITMYGFIVFDDYGGVYYAGMTLKEISAAKEEKILKHVIKRAELDENLSDIIEYICDVKRGVYIDDEWYNWESIKKYFKKFEKRMN